MNYKFSGRTSSEEKLKKIFLIAVVAVFVLLLIPMFAIARFNIPYGDDLLFGTSVGEAYREQGGFFAAVREAGNVVSRYYRDWQGTYAGIFLMALQPGVFGIQYYAITPFLMIGALLLSSIFLARTVSLTLLHSDKKTYLICVFLILLLSVQFPPSAREAFFWYNGAVYYTFFHCLFLCLVSILILFRKSDRVGGRIAYGFLGGVLSFAIAGGNYATALPCGIILALNVLLWILPNQNCSAEQKNRVCGLVFSALMLLVFCGGMLVSVTAPGNAIRQASVNETYQSLPATVAVAASFPLAFASILYRLDMGALLLVALLLLFAVPYLAQTEFSFRYPVLVVLLAFCVYASQFTPTLYAAGSLGPYRLRNLEFFNFYWLLSFSTLYIAGAVIRRKQRDVDDEPILLKKNPCRSWVIRHPLITLLLVASFVCAQFLQREITRTPACQAIIELYDGTASAHAQKRTYNLLSNEERLNVPEPVVTKESQLLS